MAESLILVKMGRAQSLISVWMGHKFGFSFDAPYGFSLVLMAQSLILVWMWPKFGFGFDAPYGFSFDTSYSLLQSPISQTDGIPNSCRFSYLLNNSSQYGLCITYKPLAPLYFFQQAEAHRN